MTTMHIHDGEGHHIGDVCGPGPVVYQPCVHTTGAHSYKALGEPAETAQEALCRLSDALVKDRGRTYNRGGVWAVEVEPSYYEPVMVFEIRRV